MTTNVHIPVTSYIGDGSITTFAFIYDLIETSDLLVLVDGIRQVEYSDYTVPFGFEHGGEVEFVEAPAANAVILIFRKTTISQNVDYESYTAFPADTHEWNLDKITYILQELIHGTFIGYDGDGNPVYLTFDLDGVAQETTVLIENSGGRDATIPMWVNAQLAGVYAGALVLEAELPADESVTTKPDGFVWLGY